MEDESYVSYMVCIPVTSRKGAIDTLKLIQRKMPFIMHIRKRNEDDSAGDREEIQFPEDKR